MSANDEVGKIDQDAAQLNRRSFLSNALMGTGLVASHVFAAGLGLRFLYPVKSDRKQRLFVGLKSQVAPGASFAYQTPQGVTVNIVRTSRGLIALSDVCPHLGCRVTWDSVRAGFFCPCHNGFFDSSGQPVSGPPKDMGAGLSSYTVTEDGDRIFLELVGGA